MRFKHLTYGLTAVSVVALMLFSAQIVETNKAENYQVKQAAISGELTIRAEPGMYMQNFGSITTYRIADDYELNSIQVRFRDGSTATIEGSVKYRQPLSHEARLKLHREQQTYHSVKSVLVRSAIEGALKQTANLFGAEEVYSTKRSDFIEMFRGQLEDGIYKTVTGRSTNEVVYSEDGTPIIAKPSVLGEYGIQVVNIEINDIDFDQKTDQLIAARKDAEQQETLARAEAVRAQQEAITVAERGKANVAKAKYDALVQKEKEVIEAQKKTAVEKEKTLQAFEFAQQEKARGEAEAFRQKALVEAGLSPKEQAEFDMRTAIGVAEALAGVKFPGVMVFGGAEEGSPTNPFDAIGVKFYQDLARDSSLQSNHSRNSN